MPLDKSRHLLDPEAVDFHILVIGCGALGSNIAVALIRMGLYKISFYDFDVLENKNVNNQAYYLDQVGMPKVDALYANLKRINPKIEKKQFFNKKFEKTTCSGEIPTKTIVIMAVDQGRRVIWDWIKAVPNVQYIVECGVNTDTFRVQAADIRNKVNMLIATPEEEVATEFSPCKEPLSIGGPIEMCAGFTATVVRSILRNEHKNLINLGHRHKIYPWVEDETHILLNK